MTVLHCALQVAFQLYALSVNADAAALLSGIVDAGGLQSSNYTLYDSSTRTLRSCWGVPFESHGQECTVEWQGAPLVAAKLQNSSSAIMSNSPMTGTFTTMTAISPYATEAIVSTGQPLTPLGAVTPFTSHKEKESAHMAAKLFPTIKEVTFATSDTPYARQISQRSITIRPILAITNEPNPVALLEGLQIEGLQLNTGSGGVNITLECVSVLRWPLQVYASRLIPVHNIYLMDSYLGWKIPSEKTLSSWHFNSGFLACRWLLFSTSPFPTSLRLSSHTCLPRAGRAFSWRGLKHSKLVSSR